MPDVAHGHQDATGYATESIPIRGNEIFNILLPRSGHEAKRGVELRQNKTEYVISIHISLLTL